MAALSAKLRSLQADDPGAQRVGFWCPGCNSSHPLNVGAGHRAGRAVWQWDGNAESPTFSPSVLVTWRDPDGELPPSICHSFVRTGRIEFLADCTHALAGQTVPLPDWPGS